jgi:transcriptional regulator with XRE-family HTH domain
VEESRVEVIISYVGKKYREGRHLSVRELAKRATIAPSTISKWENGHAVPDLRQLVVVSKELGVRFPDLISVKVG